MEYLPIFANLRDRQCLVVGGGEVAWRKTRMLLKTGAAVTLVAPEVDKEIEEAAEKGVLTWIAEPFSAKYLDGVFLAIAATDQPLVNALVSRSAEEKKLLVNVVDDTPKCSFIVPSIVDRSPIVIAISSAGKAPVLARLIREKLESLIPSHTGRMAAIAGSFRDTLKEKVTTLTGRRKFWEMAFDGRFSSLVAAGREDDAREELHDLTSGISMRGEVALVGAGPGDPGLLTLRGLQLMQQADVILYDYLVSDDVLELCRRDAEMICVGKRAGFHSVPQEETNALLVKFASRGKRVVRLKGGDPFMFGRGGEELQVVAEAGIPFQVVPGITSAAGATAYAGIPLTHRDHAQSVMFITGHLKKEKDSLDWSTLARGNQTLVIFMGLMKSDHIRDQLIKHGRAAHTPVAIIENGTRSEQRVLKGTVHDLATLAEHASSPALIVVGEVVQLAESLNWFKQFSFAADSAPDAQAVVNLE
ncbi:siroheme synthase CysG [Veronia pacifica]|uniref:Siroheme synthase n=1 Tax=Veronia pacifica TaxID=1080227 RepID=A0A1C3EQC7_9GAMM|nr:siroheme synthase CysG [Veronia pacifica]ODA35409.1 uroporphyrinogen-III C-methyltransferase [Veronia pacifica]